MLLENYAPVWMFPAFLLRVSSFCLFKKAFFCWLVLFQHIVPVSRAIPTSQQHPPKAILHIASGQKKTVQQTNERQNKTKYNKPKHNKTKYNKPTNKRQHHIPYHQPSGPLKKTQPTVTKTPQLQGNACRALEAIPLDSYHRWLLGFNQVAPSRPFEKTNIPLPENIVAKSPLQMDGWGLLFSYWVKRPLFRGFCCQFQGGVCFSARRQIFK